MTESPGLEIQLKDQFVAGLKALQALGAEEVRGHGKLRDTYGSRVSEDVGFAISPARPGKALADFLGTIPGIQLNTKSREMMGQVSSMALSEQAVRAYMLRGKGKGAGTIDAYVDFPDKYHPMKTRRNLLTVAISRSSGGKELALKLSLTDSGQFLGGIISSYDKDGEFRTERGNLIIDQHGVIFGDKNNMHKDIGDINTIKVPKLLHALTSPVGLNKPFDVKSMLLSAAQK